MEKRSEIIIALKITAAAVIAYITADLMGLEFSVSAGIVAILSVLPTKKETVKTALERLLAFVAALIIAFACYNLIGYNLPAFCLYLLIFIIFCRIFGFYSAMAMDSVLISHFLSTGRMDADTILNEVLLFLLGTILGILVNLTLRRDKKKMQELTDKTDEQIRHILYRASERILDSNLKNYDGKCLEVLDNQLDRAEKQALTDYKNDLIDSDTIDIKYIKMRRKQAEILKEIYRNVSEIKTAPDTASVISGFLAKTAEQYSRDNDVFDLINEVRTISLGFKEFPLPGSREEFEDRARLFVLMRSIEDFLLIKKEMYK
ncbi:MAG: hypothetical protein J6127_02250 [Clostridiales bacterium]|nr:hypothetical protein [Clostridiales bacterium]